MKILLYGINYAPELTGIGKYTGEMATWLARQGHEVRVVTAPPYYPAWAVSAGYANRWQVQEVDGVRVWRCPLWVPPKPGGLKRIVHLASFALSSFPVVLRQALWRPDVVWVAEPAMFCQPAAWLTARLSGAKAWLHVQDFEVDAAFDMGLLKGQGLRRRVQGVEGWFKRRFDVVSTISGRMMERLYSKGLDARRCELAPNWVDISAITRRSRSDGPSPFRQELGITPDAVVALYSGNMGGKQGLGIMAEAARLCPGVQFVLCGNGHGRADLEAAAAGLTNITFLDLQPLERLNDLLGLADIHLLPQRADAADLVMPSKLTGMLASGRPVVCTAHGHTELARVLAHHSIPLGLVTEPENPQAMASAILHLAEDAHSRRRMGRAARAHAEKNLCIDAVLTRWLGRAQVEMGSGAFEDPVQDEPSLHSTMFQPSRWAADPPAQAPAPRREEVPMPVSERV